MRYVRQQYVITTVSDDELKDNDVILSLFEKLAGTSSDVSIEYRDDRGYIKQYEKTRILSVLEDHISIRIFLKSGSMVVNNIKFDNILFLKLISSKSNIIIGEDKVEKASFLDIDGI